MDLTLKQFSVSELFDVRRGNTKFVKSYFRENPGVYPVYSASISAGAIAGLIDTYEYDCDCITWTTNGYAGHALVRSGRFSVSRDVGVLLPKQEYRNQLDLDFFAVSLTNALTSAASGRFKDSGEADYTKIATKAAGEVLVDVPIDDSGVPSIVHQKALARRFAKVKVLRSRLQDLAQKLDEMRMLEPSPATSEIAQFKVSELFERPVRGDGRLTQSYIRSNPGKYPVYSGSSSENEVAGCVRDFKFEGPCLTWSADGYAGYVFVRNGRFAANSHCGVLKPQREYQELLHLPYVALVLEPILLEAAVGRYRDDGSHDYTRVTTEMVKTVTLPLPLNDAGRIDREEQVRSADRMLALRSMRDIMFEKVESLSRARVLVEGFSVR
ncbi:restriction endonuclease subunit S [Wenxinia marina]|uniref:Type I restriction modification DNA specificity domain protein n=1 Tax=Wenxinia marina DSM 24838 TaxID=1123501 RepID=A0A0D0QIU2_9RHOB|nr:restriction endonuclease subunit S [Wenxinia marina]KIQ70978.1 Type I restriction modification DNA specificity domain protein [Wenxinia marina DSM 24838]GGL55789.1 hypothetical protein GCM10011392_07800 [Wenxinia marina]